MKRICVFLVALLCVMMIFSSCENYRSRTAEFYGSINQESFWYKGSITKGYSNYGYTQATNGASVTTIEDFKVDSYDKYVITQGDLMHYLDMEEKKYDTKQTPYAVEFLFASNEPSEFNYPKTVVETVRFNDVVCYGEIFDTVDDKGEIVGEVCYYFSGDVLVGIDWYENQTVTTRLYLEEYSETIPEDILLSIPADFRAGTFTSENFVDPWGDE